MRWWGVVSALFLLVSTVTCDAESEYYNATVTATISASVLGPEGASLALRNYAIAVLRATSVVVKPVPAPDACSNPDDLTCLQGILKDLGTGKTTIAIVTIPAGNAPAAWELRDTGIEELGEATAPSRRACLVTRPPARSLLDLTDPQLAKGYHVPDGDFEDLITQCDSECNVTLTPEWCSDKICATLLTSSEGEAKIIWHQILSHKLFATVRPLSNQLSKVATSLADGPIIACDWAPELTPLANLHTEVLGPPPCLSKQPCPFETRRIVKFVNIRELAYAPSALRALARLNLPTEKMKQLTQLAATYGGDKAAQYFYQEQPPIDRIAEVRVAVLIPKDTSREIYDASALEAAAALAEHDLEADDKLSTVARLKVEMADDACHTAGAYKYWHDALGNIEFGSLSAIIGPACSAAWTDLNKHSLPLKMPMLAFTPQAPASTPHDKTDTPLQLLAAGDAREASSALATFISRIGWHRLAVLSEPGTRPLLDALRTQAKFDVHVEVSDVGRNLSADLLLIQQWATRAAAENTRIIYLCVEDAKLARTALCAAKQVGLTPSAGAVWLLCGAQKPNWLQPGMNENCTSRELEEMAEGHFTVTPDWVLSWQKSAINTSVERRAWENRWRTQCRRLSRIPSSKKDPTSCNVTPGPMAALLYDTIQQWARAMLNLLKHNPSVADDLHNHLHVRTIINSTVSANYTGLTGPFHWNSEDGAHAREASFILSQWSLKSGSEKVGNWSKGALELNMSTINWYTSDGRVPDDGSEICGLQAFADALHTDCRTAYIALGALLVAILIAALAATALHCKRRQEKEYRKRLQALGMRPLAIKPAGLDRWEIPRERVVINRKLGTGAFGTVYGGHALLAEDRGWSAVAVKTLKAGASTEEKLDFLSEAEAMKRFDHKNVVRLLGVVTKTEPVCTVMEFMLYGDLKNYLLARRHLAMGGGEEESEADEASPRRLTGMALDVARALSYLAQLRYVHRDVAARNCLVSARRIVKLADFGMTRLVFENDYYRFSRKGMLPVRWMAPESLALGVFSPASDVWSFGVLLYEIVTFGSLPFQGLSNSEVLAKVKGGRTLDLPPGLKPQLEGLIKSCWQQDPKIRPTASEVAAYLADAPRLLAPCLDVPLDALPLDADPPWRLPRDQAEARWVSWAAPASAATDTTYLSTDGPVPLDTDSFLP